MLSRHLIFVTSSEVPETVRNGVTGIPKDAQFQIVDGRDLRRMLMAHSSTRPLLAWEASLQRQKMEWKRLYLSIMGRGGDVLQLFNNSLQHYVSKMLCYQFITHYCNIVKIWWLFGGT